jgi:hypothetical protein
MFNVEERKLKEKCRMAPARQPIRAAIPRYM